ncbi:ribosomal protein, partial [Musa troglodytarum]
FLRGLHCGRVFLNRVPNETAESDSTSSGYKNAVLVFSVGLECGNLLFGRQSPELPVRLPCPLHISLAVANPGKDLRDVEWRVEQQLDDCGSARKNKISRIWLHHLTDENECISYVKMHYSWPFIDVKLWQPFLRSQRTKCNSFTVELQEFLAQQQRTCLQMRTNLKVVDNSGGKRARLGDTILASVKEAQPRGKVKKGDVVYGVVVRAAMQREHCDGNEIEFDDNVVVLANKQGEPIGTRAFGPLPHEPRK